MINRNTYKLNLDRRLLFAAAGITAAIMPIAGELFCTPSVRAQQTTGALEFDRGVGENRRIRTAGMGRWSA